MKKIFNNRSKITSGTLRYFSNNGNAKYMYLHIFKGSAVLNDKLDANINNMTSEIIENEKITIKENNLQSDRENEPPTNTNLYVLKLVEDKFYVGITKKPIPERIDDHYRGFGSIWTRIYKPVSVVLIKENVDDFEEDKITKMYMNQYGIDNVRGGSYTSIVLKNFQKKALEYELLTASNKCFYCKQEGHFAKNCKLKNSIPIGCQRCGHTNHTLENCYANHHINGSELQKDIIFRK